MTYENLLKWKKFFEDKKDTNNLNRVLRNLKAYGKPEDQKEKK